MEDWFATYGLAALMVVVGIVISTGGGLLSLTTDPEQPAKFIPVYLVSMTIFLAGLGLIMWCAQVAKYVSENYITG